jgi:transposase-like protein
MRRECSSATLGEFWVQYEPANLVDWGGFRVPQMFTAGFLDERFRILIEVVLEDNGPECVSISKLDYHAPPLTSERRFPVRAMVNAALRAAAHELVRLPIGEVDPKRSNPRLRPDETGHVEVHAPAFDERGEQRARVRPKTAEAQQKLERVAALYRRAVASGSPPSIAIANEFDVTPATARKWVQRARERGLLGAAVGRRACESGRTAGSRTAGAAKSTQFALK